MGPYVGLRGYEGCLGFPRARLPARLQGHRAPIGVIGPRIAPVFRDRDEMPSASNLGETLRTHLAPSATRAESSRSTRPPRRPTGCWSGASRRPANFEARESEI